MTPLKPPFFLFFPLALLLSHATSASRPIKEVSLTKIRPLHGPDATHGVIAQALRDPFVAAIQNSRKDAGCGAGWA